MDSSECKGMQDYRRYLREVTAIQSETLRRLVGDDSTPPLEVAAVLEDIANLFLNVSDEIRDFALGRPESGRSSPSASAAAAHPVSVPG